MTNNDKEKETKVNWTPIIVGGVVLGGLFLIWKIMQTITGETPEKQEQARLILQDWQNEFDVLKPMVESMYAGGRIPTEQEIATLNAMTEHMATKEILLRNTSESVFQQFIDAVEELAKNWWLVPLAVFTPIAGYATYKLVKGWKNNRQPPPSFPCPKCGAVYSSEEALKYHIQNEHRPNIANATQARQAFDQTSSWVQHAVAVETYYGQTFTNWSTWSLPQLADLNWGLTSAWVYGVGAASELILLRTALTLLLI
jgi:hypothetical protein